MTVWSFSGIYMLPYMKWDLEEIALTNSYIYIKLYDGARVRGVTLSEY